MRISPTVIRWWHIAFALALVALLDIYELTITIPELTRIAGAPIFDMRVHGYDAADASRLLAALGAEGRWYYLSYHVPADTALAVIEATAIILIILRVTRPGARYALSVPRTGRMGLLAAPALMLIFDLGENAVVAQMLSAGAAEPAEVAIAAVLTQAKWVMASLAIATALALPPSAWLRGRRRRVSYPQQSAPR